MGQQVACVLHVVEEVNVQYGVFQGFERSDFDFGQLFLGNAIDFIGHDSLTLGVARGGGASGRFRRRLRGGRGGGLGRVGGESEASCGEEAEEGVH